MSIYRMLLLVLLGTIYANLPSAAQDSSSRDMNDVVVKVLNYSTYGMDEGRKDDFWYKSPDAKCLYKQKMSEAYAEELKPTLLFFGMMGGITLVNEINFEELDPRGIRFRTDRWGTFTMHDAKVLTYAPAKLDLDRLSRGWALIYKNYCSGKKREF